MIDSYITPEIQLFQNDPLPSTKTMLML